MVSHPTSHQTHQTLAQPDPAIIALLQEFQDVFPDTIPLGLPPQREGDHSIDLEENDKPPAHRIYCMAPAELQELRAQLDVYIKAGQIEPARSPFGASVLF